MNIVTGIAGFTRSRNTLIGCLSGACLVLMLRLTIAQACTDMILPPTSFPPEFDADGQDVNAAVSARTMDFEANLAWFMETQNASTAVTSTDPPGIGKHPLKWTSKYRLIGFRNAESLSKNGEYYDGLNEHGLSAALLWLDKAWPDDGVDGFPNPVSGDSNLSIKYVVNYILSQCRDVPCVMNEMFLNPEKTKRPTVWGEAMKVLYKDVPLALHLIVHDAQNRTAVVEWYDKQEFVYWDPNGNVSTLPDQIRVLANDPPFGDQVRNLMSDEFKRLTRSNHYKEAKGYATKPGQNFLPGDSSSGSRFIRTYKLNRAVTKTEGEGYMPRYPAKWLFATLKPKLWRVQLANRVISRAEEVWGEYPEPIFSLQSFFHTNWTVIRDHTNLMLYVRGVYNASLRRIDFRGLFAKNPQNYSKQYVDPYPEKFPNLVHFQDISEYFTPDLPDQ